MHKHHSLLFFSILLFLVLGITGALLFHTYFQKPKFQAISQEESAKVLKNPYCGYYHLYGYRLSEDGTAPAKKWVSQMLATDDNSILLLQINLADYSQGLLSENALAQLDCIISSFAAADKQMILRFLYDWDGKALSTEPSSIEKIKTHMTQVAPVVNAYTNHVFLLQGVFTGNCGEMNQTHYGSAKDIRDLMNHLSSVILPEIYLSVRTPAQLRTILESSSPFAETSPYDGSLSARLGLFNDGMFGNAFDCGTYDDTPLTETSDITEKGTRQEELAFQNNFCPYVPNGGEAVLANSYNDLDKAIPDLFTMRISYLSCDHEASVLEKWKKNKYPGKDKTFQGVSGYNYIGAHLGYRYFLKSVTLTREGLLSPQLKLQLTVSNEGFAPSYRAFETSMILTDETGNSTTFPVLFDTRTLDSTQEKTLFVTIPQKELAKGNYSISLQMKDLSTGLSIHFANQSAKDNGSVPCGTLQVP